MAKPALILVGADKGGVGKTTVARTLLDYFTAHNVPTRAFDTETPKGTLKRFHRDVSEMVDATAVADQMRIIDTLSTTDATVTVVDVRAGLMSPTLHGCAISAFSKRSRRGRSPLWCSISSARRLLRGTRSRKLRRSPPTPNISWSRTSSTTPISSSWIRRHMLRTLR